MHTIVLMFSNICAAKFQGQCGWTHPLSCFIHIQSDVRSNEDTWQPRTKRKRRACTSQYTNYKTIEQSHRKSDWSTSRNRVNFADPSVRVNKKGSSFPQDTQCGPRPGAKADTDINFIRAECRKRKDIPYQNLTITYYLLVVYYPGCSITYGRSAVKRILAHARTFPHQ